MHHWMTLFSTWFFLLCIPSTCWATVDVGRTARLIGVAGAGRWAIVSEEAVGESCEYDSCLVYGIDVTRRDFVRKFSVTLPARNDELRKEVCLGRVDATCKKKVAERLHEEIQATEAGNDQVLPRYVKRLRFWQRVHLGAIEPPPSELRLTEEKSWQEGLGSLSLPELGPPSVRLTLQERWDLASYRAFNDQGEECEPTRLEACHQEERWEDGVRSQRTVCDEASEPSKRGEDCAGRASVVRVVAHRGEGQSVGRSNLVEPGAIAGFYVGEVRDRRVAVDKLAFVKHETHVYRVGSSLFAVGAFCEGRGGNATWFPFAVAIPP